RRDPQALALRLGHKSVDPHQRRKLHPRHARPHPERPRPRRLDDLLRRQRPRAGRGDAADYWRFGGAIAASATLVIRIAEPRRREGAKTDAKLIFVGVDYALDTVFELRDIEIDQQGERKVQYLQVADRLGAMQFRQAFDALQLDDQALVHEQIDETFAHFD